VGVVGRPTSEGRGRRGASLRRYLHELVADADASGVRLPSEQELSKRFGVSRNLVREVIESFAAAGMVRREWGVGTFVTGTARAVASSLAELRPLSELVTSQGHACRVVLGSFDLRAAHEVPLPPSVESWSDEYWRLPRVYWIDDEPAILITDYVPARLGGKEFSPSVVTDDVMPIVEEHYGVDIGYATASLFPMLADNEVRETLKCAADTPLLKIEQVTYTVSDEPVIYATGYHKTDRFTHTVVRYRTRSRTPW
jgi:DNA-binding GntR family transcriptional regulator